jgi:hypothetical protein
MPFIINEDEALKTLLQGITVSDSGNATRPVAVYYGQPDKDLRQQIYPYITLDLVGVREDTERAHRGVVNLTYTPEGMLPNLNQDSSINQPVEFPIPVDLIYQVSTWSRQPRHDRQIMSKLFAPGRLPFRFGQLPIPQDGTNRRLDVLGFSKRDTTEGGKRLFSNVYNIRISSELFVDQLTAVYQVTDVNTSLGYQTTSPTTIWSTTPSH